jgi:hypothetical protein
MWSCAIDSSDVGSARHEALPNQMRIDLSDQQGYPSLAQRQRTVRRDDVLQLGSDQGDIAANDNLRSTKHGVWFGNLGGTSVEGTGGRGMQ